MKKKLFLTFSACVFSFTIIFICTALFVNWDIIAASFWRDDICGEKDYLCYSKKAMYFLEYFTASIDIVFGFICTVLGFLHLFDLKKINSRVIGALGFISACIIFIITTFYLCYSGYIFVNVETKSYDDGYSYDKLMKLNEDGAFAEYDYQRNEYKCIFYNGHQNNFIAKYKDLGKKQYNYQKDKYFNYGYAYSSCIANGYDLCYLPNREYIPYYEYYMHNGCNYLYLGSIFQGFENKYIYDRWMTTLIISCLIILSTIGMAIFGFLLIKEKN